MASPFGTIGQLALGSLVSRGADRLLDPNKRNVVGINKFVPQGGYFGTEGDDETKTGPTTLGGIAKTGIMSLIANAIFGPIFAPLALNLATRFVDKRKGLGFFGQESPTIPAKCMTASFFVINFCISDSFLISPLTNSTLLFGLKS